MFREFLIEAVGTILFLVIMSSVVWFCFVVIPAQSSMDNESTVQGEQ